MAGLMVVSLPTRAGIIDLNAFVPDPGVTIAADGLSAMLREDSSPAVGAVLLVNDPGLGDSEVIVPNVGAVLRFDYNLVLGPSDRDEFSAYIIDTLTGVTVGSGWEFVLDIGGSGTVTFTLSGLVGRTLGLVFLLERLPGDRDTAAVVTISNLAITDASAPATLALFVAGLLATLPLRRCRMRDAGVARRARCGHAAGVADVETESLPAARCAALSER